MLKIILSFCIHETVYRVLNFRTLHILNDIKLQWTGTLNDADLHCLVKCHLFILLLLYFLADQHIVRGGHITL